MKTKTTKELMEGYAPRFEPIDKIEMIGEEDE